MRKEIQGMLRELPSLLTMRFQQVRCKDAILIRAAEENELSMTGAPVHCIRVHGIRIVLQPLSPVYGQNQAFGACYAQRTCTCGGKKSL